MEDSNTFETKRQKLIRILKTENMGWLDLRAILKEMEYQSKRALINDVESIAKTLKNDGLQLIVNPPSCIACGFTFKLKGSTLKIPSKCPKCRQQRIDWPSIKIKI